jgi:shikimate dehydrogenase
VNFVRCDQNRKLTGTNTDGAGFVAGLEANGVTVRGRKAVMVGAGGVARAIAFSLADAGLAELVIANRSMDKAATLASDVAQTIATCSTRTCDPNDPNATAGMDLVINATTLGMQEGDALPLDISSLESRATVVEVIVNPAITPLLAASARLGCTTVSGVEMLKPQPRLVAEFMDLRPI